MLKPERFDVAQPCFLVKATAQCIVHCQSDFT